MMLVGAEEVLYAVVSAVVEEVEVPAEVVSAVTDNARVREGGGRGGSSLRKGVDLSHGSGDGGRMTGKTGIGLERQDLTEWCWVCLDASKGEGTEGRSASSLFSSQNHESRTAEPAREGNNLVVLPMTPFSPCDWGNNKSFDWDIDLIHLILVSIGRRLLTPSTCQTTSTWSHTKPWCQL